MITPFNHYKILLLNSDPVYGTEMLAIAGRANIELVFKRSLIDLGRISGLQGYDLIIVDDSLDCHQGSEIGQYVDSFFSDIPVILTTSDEDYSATLNQDDLPRCIRAIINQSYRPDDLIKKCRYILDNPSSPLEKNQETPSTRYAT